MNNAQAHQKQRPIVVLQPARGWTGFNLRELWQYRDLFLILITRDVKLRYKQTALGVLWVVLQPLIAALIFAVIFGLFAKMPSGGLPYPLFVFCGLLPWNYLAGILQRAGNSLVSDARLISKVYFPRLLIPLASIGAVLVDFLVSLGVMLVLMAIYHVTLSWRVVALPYFLLLAALTASGISLWFSALNVQYRDFMYAMPFLIQVWLYASPVVYAADIVPEKWQLIYSLNPAVGILEGFRWALLGTNALTISTVILTSAVALVAFVSGALFFRRVERRFADVV